MKYLLIAVIGLTLSSCGNDVGRYQLMESSTRLFDTKTGAIYHKKTYSNGVASEWIQYTGSVKSVK